MSSVAGVDLDRIKLINNRDKDLVFGFIKDCQCLLPDISSNTYYTIPQIAFYVCLLFYHQFDEWDAENQGNGYILSADDPKLLTRDGMGYQSAFLSTIVRKNGIYKWRFKVENFKSDYLGWDWIIGIWKVNGSGGTEQEACRSFFTPRKIDDGYGWLASCQRLTNPKMCGCYLNEKPYGQPIKNGDIIEMILNLNQFKLHWTINDKHLPIAYENIEDCQYKAAVMLASRDNKIRLLD